MRIGNPAGVDISGPPGTTRIARLAWPAPVTAGKVRYADPRTINSNSLAASVRVALSYLDWVGRKYYLLSDHTCGLAR